MNESTSTPVFGFIPLSRLQQLNAAAEKEEFNFLLNLYDFHDQMKQFIPRELSHAKQQLNERISLLALVAIITGKSDFIKVGMLLAKSYAKYSPDTECLKNSSGILEDSFNENWFIDVQKIALIWKKSHVFAKHIKNELPEERCKLLDNPSLFLDFNLILRASQAYEIQKKSQAILKEWEHVLNYDYGLIESSKISHLGSFNNINKSYTVLLDFTILLNSPLQANEQLLFHVSRRIIALASAALLTSKNKYFLAASELLEKINEKTEGSPNEDLDKSATYLLKAKFIAKDQDVLWKSKWPSLQLNLEKNPKTAALLNTLDLSVLKNNDLDSTLDKYLLIKQLEKILIGTKDLTPRSKRERSVSFETNNKESDNSPRDESGSSTFNSPRDESGELYSPREEKKKEIKKLELNSKDSKQRDFASDTGEIEKYSTYHAHVPETEHKDNDGIWEISWPKNNKKRKSKEYLSEIKQLETWLINYYPSVYDLYVSRGSRESLKIFLKKYNHNLLLDFFDDQENLYCTAAKHCLHHESTLIERRVPLPDGDNKIFNLYKRALEKAGASYLCLEYFLIHNNVLAVEYLNDDQYFNFLSFIYHKHNEICTRFLEEHQEAILGTNNILRGAYFKKLKSLVRLKTRKSEHSKGEKEERIASDEIKSLDIPQCSSNAKMRKQYLYLLHRNHQFQTFLKCALTFFYKTRPNELVEDEISEILFSHVTARIEDKDKYVRANILKILDILNSILTLSIFNKYCKKSKMLSACYDFFLQHYPSVVGDYLKNDIYFNFFRFLKEKHQNLLQLFFIEILLQDLKFIVLSIDTKSKRSFENSMLENEVPIVSSYSSSPFTRAKQYTHLLHTSRNLQTAFVSMFADKLESLMIKEESIFEITEADALSIKKSSRIIVKINNSIYKIINLEKSHNTTTLYELKLSDYKFSKYHINHEPIDISELTNENLINSDRNFLMISKKSGLKINSMLREDPDVQIKIDNKIYKVVSLQEIKQIRHKWKLAAVLLQDDDDSKNIFKLKNPNLLRPPMSIEDIIAQLQDPNLKVRKKIVKQLDTLRSCFPEAFSIK